jgi:outer membrane lipoprotein-sorting protein
LKSRSSHRVARLGLVAALLASALFPSPAEPRPRKRHLPPDLAEIVKHMDDAASRLNTLSADLQYTKFTAVVNDKSTQEGQFFFHKGKPPEVKIEFKNPDARTILVKKNEAQMYLPKTNQIQVYALGQRGELLQQFLLLGFGSEVAKLKKDYGIRLIGEEDLSGDTTAVLELTPRQESVVSKLAKVQLWISEESWLPVQQKFFEPGNDYAIALYSAVRVNRHLDSGTFEIHAPGAKRVKMQ